MGVIDWERKGKDELSTQWERNMKGEKSHNAFGEVVLLAIVQIRVLLRCLCMHACMLSHVQLYATPQRLFVPPGKPKLVVRNVNEALGRHSVHSVHASRKSLSVPTECVCVLNHFSRV